MAKKFILQILIILVVIFTIDRILASYLDALFVENKCDYSNGKLNVFLEEDNCDTLFLGSSRVLHMIKPELLGPGSRNLAFQQKHLYHNVAIFDILKKAGKLPRKLLVLNIDVEDLYMVNEEQLIDQLYSLKYYYDKNEIVRDLTNRNGFAERIKFCSKLYHHNGDGWKLISYPLSYNCLPLSKDGYSPLYTSDLDSIRLEKSLIDDFQALHLDEINPVAIQMLDYFIETCSSAGIRLKIINSPFYKFHPALKIASKKMNEYCVSKQVEFIDFNDFHIIGLEKKEFWYDNMHLNNQGASIYTRYLKRILLQEEFRLHSE